MDKFLIELLLNNGSVILPEFGAIVIANEDTGEVMFNEYLKFNDGKLVAIIVDNSSMDDQDASNMVAKYVRDIQIQLDKGESYDIFGLGSFVKDNDGSTIFNGNIKTTAKKEAEEFLGPSPTPTPTPEPTKVVTPEPKKEARPEVNQTIPPNEPNVAKEEIPAEPVAEKKEEKASQKEKVKKVVPPKEKKKRGVIFWILIFLLVIVAGGGIFVGIKYEEVKSYMGWDKFENVETIAELDETIPADGIAENETDPEEEDTVEDDLVDTEIAEETEEASDDYSEDEISSTEEEEIIAASSEPINEVAVSTDGKSFHLIGGSFSEVSNAEKFVAELKAKGLPAHVVGQFNGLHMVSAKSYSSRSEAVGEISTIQNDAPGAWLFKYPK